jgi:hypothetical protein
VFDVLPVKHLQCWPVTGLPLRALFLLRHRRLIPINFLENYLMKITTAGHCEASATTRTPRALQSPCGGKLNNALRGTMLCLALGLGAASLPAFAASRVVIRVAPPAMQVEEVPAPRAGYVWAPGYWRWQNRQHVWAKGHWERERRGQRYESPRWEQKGDRYQFAPGRWQRDANRKGG